MDALDVFSFDIWIEIFSFVGDLSTLSSLRRSCVLFKNISSSGFLFKRLIENFFPEFAECEPCKLAPVLPDSVNGNKPKVVLFGQKDKYECLCRSDQVNFSGLYIGEYGTHGLEFIEIIQHGYEVKGLKLTGDPNVPAGKYSFEVVFNAEVWLFRSLTFVLS